MQDLKIIVYNGNDIFGFNANLYGLETIRWQATKNNILREFKKEFKDDLKTVLAGLGLKYRSLKYYSPREYNYLGDSIDLSIEVINYDKFKAAAIANEEAINKLLANNKSYDGYMALTYNNLDEEIESEDISTITLGYLLQQKIDFYNRFDISDYYLNDYRLKEFKY